MSSSETTVPNVAFGTSRRMPLLQFSGIPGALDFDQLLEKAESIVVQRTEDRRPFRAVIECLQNLERHAAAGSPISFRLYGRSIDGEPRFTIRTVNTMCPEDFGRIQEWVTRLHSWNEQVASSSREAVAWRQLFRSALAWETRTPRGGAGLGWLSLARFSATPPAIRILSGQRLFFSVEVACGG